MKKRTPISDDITIILSESGCLSIYSRIDDVSVHLNEEEAREIFEWLKQYLGRNEPRTQTPPTSVRTAARS